MGVLGITDNYNVVDNLEKRVRSRQACVFRFLVRAESFGCHVTIAVRLCHRCCWTAHQVLESSNYC